MQTSARFGVQFPSADRTDAPDIPTHLANIVAGLERSAMYGQGPVGSRPVSTVGTPGIQGRFYVSTDESPQQLYYDFGTGWFQVGALAAGGVGTTQLADGSVTLAKLAANSVDGSKIIDGSVGAPEILDGSVGTSEVAAALKPSQGAGAATETLRSLGTAAGQAAAGSHASQHALAGSDPLPASSVGVSQLTNPPHCVLSKNADHSIPNGGAPLSWQVVSRDTNSMADLLNNQIVIRTSGFYRVVASVAWADSSAGFYKGTLLRKNGVTLGTGNYIPNLNTGFAGQVSVVIAELPLIVNDLLSVFANQNTGLALTVWGTGPNAYQTYLSAIRLGS